MLHSFLIEIIAFAFRSCAWNRLGRVCRVRCRLQQTEETKRNTPHSAKHIDVCQRWGRKYTFAEWLLLSLKVETAEKTDYLRIKTKCLVLFFVAHTMLLAFK